MDDLTEHLYLRGDVESLIAIVRRAGEMQEDDRGAYRALTLLARLGDAQAATFCQGAGAGESSDAA
jgi:hypothetical protein